MNSPRSAKNLLRKVYKNKGSMDWRPKGFYDIDGSGRYVLHVSCDKCGIIVTSLLDTCPVCGRIWKYCLK